MREYKREKKKCARLYADWRDDEYNLLHNYFIWGYSIQQKTSKTSFDTWNDIQVYYNRITKRYYYQIDIGIYEDKVAALEELQAAFYDYVRGLPTGKSVVDWLELQEEGASSLNQLYIKFSLYCDNYKSLLK